MLLYYLEISPRIHLDGNIYLAVGDTISGDIIGDHCSPISYTTIMSSMATDIMLGLRSPMPS
ncbi:hypothetical protein DYH56_10835 [Psychrilyobacter piezotolerans]|uniref:Uncharacterized protein n=1 Tax=Psychrilyobacter piezotolerans TaxID=2293438 RepID=A0ABX9KG22_9FUSO|nr:hypothetical protein [Psychrilyobacter piezotolerans]RDE60495.1 hypothetical protein DV867_10835 [Psychrilyobacter sp. S5]REI40525.1 hypothetical protein DYH56_10835 [Psychrilyobacter piezotolerans]